ncbi:uncharacterized protein LOC144100385 [Amblyomma americanum]
METIDSSIRLVHKVFWSPDAFVMKGILCSLSLPLAMVLATNLPPKGEYGEACIPCSCPQPGVAICRVNNETGCQCVNGIYRMGQRGVCGVHALCEVHDDLHDFMASRVARGPRIPVGPRA